MIAGIGRELEAKVDRLFPERAGTDAHAPADGLPDSFYERASAIRAEGSGYVQGIDIEALLETASAHGLVLDIRYRPGDFVSRDDVLVHAASDDISDDSDVSDDLRARMRGAFVLGAHRTARQDTRFLVNELVEIAARALSPGVNDPFTATSCLDWLSAGLKRLADRDFPSPYRCDADGTLRLVAAPPTYDEFVRHVYAQLRPYLAADRNAALYALKTIGEVSAHVDRDTYRDALRTEADALLQAVEATLVIRADLEAIRTRHRQVVRLLSGRLYYADVVLETAWIGGTA